ncbi:MAG: heme o synthase [Legionellales bacterium]|nr:heme o synthase [Legionellales bacterium]
MSNPTDTVAIIPTHHSLWRSYWELCKPRVVALMLITAIVGMHLATPGWVPLHVLLLGCLGIALCAGSAASINHVVDRKIDTQMWRTKRRPLPTGQVSPRQALLFAIMLGCSGFFMLAVFINMLTAWLTLLTLTGYAIFYTMFLKYATPQNIVIGGAAGAAPPLLGWTAVTGHLSPYALLLVLIIYAWTPPHAWALAIYRRDDYAKAGVPMLPVTHGIAYTKINILLYSFLLVAATLLPYAAGMSGLIYLVGSLLLGARALWWAWRLYRTQENIIAMKLFRFSIIYLFLLFIIMLIDHYYLIKW